MGNLTQSFVLFVAGMGLLFLFFAVLVGAVNGLHKLLGRYGGPACAESPATKAGPPPSADLPTPAPSEVLIAVALASIAARNGCADMDANARIAVALAAAAAHRRSAGAA